jgi:hypothetical protein
LPIPADTPERRAETLLTVEPAFGNADDRLEGLASLAIDL